MATKTNPPGLLGKMVQFMRAPGSERPDANESVQSADSEREKLALQERIAQRRQDDLVRRREFNYLRQIRSMTPQALSGGVPRPSLFSNSSSFNPEELTPQERARTLRKIDAIEAHMAHNWAQHSRADEGRPVTPPPASAVVDAPTPPAPPPPAAKAPAPTHSFGEAMDSEMDLDFTAMLSATALAPTQPMALTPEPAPPAASPPLPTAKAPARTAREEVAPNDFSSSFSNSRLTSQELGGGLEPALQEASIRFADGDDAGAEAALVAVVQAPDADIEAALACAAALLDLYRATDQPASFEVVALEYAQRFGRSPPEWFSVPDRLRHHAAPAAATVPQGASGTSVWHCPALLTLAAVEALRAGQTSPKSRQVQWAALQTVQPEAVRPLADTFTAWAALPLDLHFGGEEVLNAVLQAATPSGDRSVDAQCWHLRLEALRIQGLHEAFESAALDYCITYEVSPPSWQEADCTFVHESPPPVVETAPGGDSQLSPLDEATAPPRLLELRGEVLGDAVPMLQSLQVQVRPGEPMVISCAQLIRVDFLAAGSVLNWLTAHQAEIGTVQFVGVPRLVAAFFQVMGITAVADVVVGRQ